MLRCYLLSCLLLVVPPLSSASEMSPKELVHNYTDTLAKQGKFALKFTDKRVTTSQMFMHPAGKPPDEKPINYTKYSSGEVITDGRRVAVRKKEWGQAYRNTRATVASNPVYIRDTFDGRQQWNYHRHPQSTRKPRGELGIDRNPRHEPMLAACLADPGLSLLGYMTMHRIRIDDALRDPSAKLVVRKELENIGGVDCYVLDVSSLYGRGTVWLDPEHGYNMAQAHFSLRTGDVFKPTNKPITDPWESQFYWRDMTFTLVEGVWFPTQGTFECSVDCQRYWSKSAHHLKITEVQLNPDMDAMDAFSTEDIPDGAICAYVGQRVPAGSSTPYVWQDGQVIIRSGR